MIWQCGVRDVCGTVHRSAFIVLCANHVYILAAVLLERQLMSLQQCQWLQFVCQLLDNACLHIS
jgi:hypothetical protein